MPVFSCGGMRYQNGGGNMSLDEIPDEGQKNLEATIHRAVEVGINHIETARGYGSSELQLGLVLPKLPREKIIVQTKVGPSEDVKQFIKTVETSLRTLQLDYIDLLGLHGINNRQTLEWSVRPGGCLDAARELQRKGLCRHIGFSTHGPTDVIVDAINHRNPDTGEGFDYVNLHWYYIFQRNWPAIEAATKRDMGVFIISPSDKGGRLYDPPDKLRKLCSPLDPMVFNDLFCLARPQVHTLSVGAAKPSDFNVHLDTLPLLDRAAEVLAPIEAKLSQAMREATGLPHPEQGVWDLPDPDRVAGGVNMPIILWLRNLTVGWDMREYGKMRYNLLGNGGHWFPGQNVSKLDDSASRKLRDVLADTRFGRTVRDLLDEAHDLLAGEEVKRLTESD